MYKLCVTGVSSLHFYHILQVLQIVFDPFLQLVEHAYVKSGCWESVLSVEFVPNFNQVRQSELEVLMGIDPDVFDYFLKSFSDTNVYTRGRDYFEA